MIPFDDLVRRVGRIQPQELESWIAEGWVRPQGQRGAWLFHDVDLARVRLIVEIRYELAVDEEAVPLVLSLMDQLYAVRRQLRMLSGAVQAETEEVRQRILDRLSLPQ